MAYQFLARSAGSQRDGFELRMQANRSLTPRSRTHIWLAGSVVLLTFSLRFVILGAWPVAIFALADIALLGCALLAFDRCPAMTERLSLDDGVLNLCGGDGRAVSMPAYWTRLETVERTPLDLSLWLRFRGERYPLGMCLALHERREVAARIGRALDTCREGRAISAFDCRETGIR